MTAVAHRSEHGLLGYRDVPAEAYWGRYVAGITANIQALRAAVENSIGLVTALNPYIGYEAATGIAQEALATGRGVAELVLDKGLLPAGSLDELLRLEAVVPRPSRDPVTPWCDVIRRDPD
ncbi:putative Fumarate hydratase class II [Streptomyces viridochromogenes Tue57]|uniref:aspartate ammonia-lyase n=1 Tax=Streptomyces viridochromogenes Tue57 TaxID=1160705 RepID=L8PU95_STRVR|nr:putative Fumarate hydratase class II [Streptomyces viridochromogenes Tue57]